MTVLFHEETRLLGLTSRKQPSLLTPLPQGWCHRITCDRSRPQRQCPSALRCCPFSSSHYRLSPHGPRGDHHGPALPVRGAAQPHRNGPFHGPSDGALTMDGKAVLEWDRTGDIQEEESLERIFTLSHFAGEKEAICPCFHNGKSFESAS